MSLECSISLEKKLYFSTKYNHSSHSSLCSIGILLKHFIFSKRVFILGPSHHVSLGGCALTQTKTYSTPLYDLKVDLEGKILHFYHSVLNLLDSLRLSVVFFFIKKQPIFGKK